MSGVRSKLSRLGWYMTVCLIAVIAVNALDNRRPSTEVFRQRLREYFGCSPCDVDLCPIVPNDCVETALEIGVCACCRVCALAEGRACGVHTPPCASHLSCTPSNLRNNRDGILQLLEGHGVCLPSQRGEINVTFGIPFLCLIICSVLYGTCRFSESLYLTSAFF